MKKKSEHQIQVELMSWCALMVYKKVCPELRLIYAIPNGGHRHKLTGAKLKAEGVKAGVPDLCLPVARHGFHGMYLELKRDPKLKLSPKQKVWFQDLREQGYWCVKCGSFQEAVQELSSYLGF